MRSAQGQAKEAANTAASTGGSLMGSGTAINSTLTPYLTGKLTAEHAFSPDQLNELLTSSEAGAGGATSGLTGQAELEAARTGQGPNAGIYDALARGKAQAAAKSSESIAGQDVTQALQNQRFAASQLGEMGQADIDDALKAMGLQTGDINAEVEAGKSGWFQNMTSLIQSMRGGGGGNNPFGNSLV